MDRRSLSIKPTDEAQAIIQQQTRSLELALAPIAAKLSEADEATVARYLEEATASLDAISLNTNAVL
jgi:DNA-binding MarR family transcriptional regulator